MAGLDSEVNALLNSSSQTSSDGVVSGPPCKTMDFLKLAGIDWSMDYVVKSRRLDHLNTLLFFVRIHVETSTITTIQPLSPGASDLPSPADTQDKTQYIEFVCTLEQLQDLVSKLRDAIKQTERIVASSLPSSSSRGK
eukprot:GILI01016416.1.p1 GENE.GILI01016416.1~~GILI01016416.1.p1  ORF type:complete len:138 (-),score=17.76 GILI01016416.1:41-454(-)